VTAPAKRRATQRPATGAGTHVPPRAGQKAARAGGPATGATSTTSRSPSASAARQARRRRNQWAGIAVGAVVAVVAAVVAIGASAGGGGSDFTPRTAAPAAMVSHLATVPTSALAGALPAVEASSNPLEPALSLTGAPLLANGKPEVLFIGAEYCPICAAERWALVTALSKFGTFSGLGQIRSANRDGNIATLDFYGSHYSSPSLTFTPVEVDTNQPSGSSTYKPLQALTAGQQSLWESTLAKFGQRPGFPFIDIGGKYLLYTSQISPSTVSGLTWTQISNDVGNNNSPVGAAIDASAGALVKYLCGITGGQPAATCRAVAGANAPVATTSPGGASSTAG
jgi:hypothetical protein